MNPIIIVLGVLILIVVVVIIVILIKGKDGGEKELSDVGGSGMTFQEEDKPTQKQTPVEPELISPQLHEKKESVVEVNPNQPVMNDLTTPQQAPPVEPTSVPITEEQPTIQQSLEQKAPTSMMENKTMYQPNSLPKDPQIDKDLEKLNKSAQNSAPSPIIAPTDNNIDTANPPQSAPITPTVNPGAEVPLQQVIPKEVSAGVDTSPLPTMKAKDTPSDQLQDLKNKINETVNTQPPITPEPIKPTPPVPPLGQNTQPMPPPQPPTI